MESKADLSGLTTQGVAELELLHPGNNTPLGVTLLMVGADSEEARQYERQMTNRRLARAMRKGKVKLTAEELEEEVLELLATVTKGWRPELLQLVKDGPELPYSHENAKTLYRTLRWAREQADEFMSERANFLPR